MIRISVNVLSVVHILMTKLIKFGISDIDSLYNINNYQLDTKWVVEIAKKCKWIIIVDNGFKITDRGYEIFRKEKYLNKNVYRLMLYDYIISICPIKPNF